MADETNASAQSAWEYLELTRETESYLVNDMNQLGEEGWELITVVYHKDVKMGESWLWTAIMKRPKIQAAGPSTVLGRGAALQAAPVLAASASEGPGAEADIFDVKDE